MDNHHHHRDDHDHHDAEAMADLLDLDADVLHSYHVDVTAWVHELAADSPRRRIVDLGSGTGTGTLALLQHFDEAEMIAVDMSDRMLERLADKARDRGMADRIRTIPADLDVAWPAIDAVDLVWAANSLHHVADPDRVLAAIFGALRSGGILAVAEMNGFPRFLPDDIGLGRPGLEERCHAAVSTTVADELPHLGDDWGGHLRHAGFTIVAERTFAIDLRPPLPDATGRYAQASLRMFRSGLGGRLDADDLATLDTLIGDGPDSIARRDDITVRSTRTVWVAGRP